MIKAVIFDLGGVIVPFDFARAYASIERLNGLDPEAIRSRLAVGGIVEAFETGLIEPRDFAREVAARLNLDLSFEEFTALWCSIFKPEPLIPEALFAGLKENYRLVLLSNTNALHFEMLSTAYPLLSHFNHRVLSYKVKAMKPAAAIYDEAIRAAQCRPHECFYTDDIASFVDGARRVGIDAEQFLGYGKLQADLHWRGVTFE